MRRSFALRGSFDEDELLGARWWNDSFIASTEAIGRRSFGRNALWVAGALMGGGLLAVLCSDDEDDEVIQTLDALDLQRREGWDVGRPGSEAALPFATDVNVAGGTRFRADLPLLGDLLRPRDARLAPYYVPTLFQAAAHTRNESLRRSLRPMRTPGMKTSHGAAEALRALFADVDGPQSTALVLDLPGPEAIAAAAALADLFAPVFLFDNWPHPRGVVPSHEVLAAALYHLPQFQAAADRRQDPAPIAFVLDDRRLQPYRDEADQFDNRYLARLPSAPAFRDLGVRHVLYVRPAGAPSQELDDLNEDFVALDRAGIAVRTVSLGDFGAAAPPSSAAETSPRHYWGGSPGTHVHFWSSYGWYAPARHSWAPAPRVSLSPAAVQTPSAAYRPAPRPTIFSARAIGGRPGIGKQKPSGFGRVSFRTSRTTGAFSGYGGSRSGSFGRSRSSWSG